MQKFFDVLQKPSVIFGFMIAGIILGMAFSKIPVFITDFSELYICILQMIASFMLPLAIVKSIGKLMQTKSDKSFIKKVTILFIIMMFSVSIVPIVIGIVSEPVTGINFETKKAIGRMMIQKSDELDNSKGNLFISELNTTQEEGTIEKETLSDFFIKIFPSNIFNALAQGDSIKIVFFSIVLGIALSYNSVNSRMIIEISESLYDAFFEILQRVMYFLPFALLSIMAEQFKGITLESVFYFYKFIIYIFLSIMTVFFLCMLIIVKVSGHGFVKQISSFKIPLIISFVSSTTITAMPSAIESLIVKLGRKKNEVNLVVPLFISISVFGNIMMFSTTSFFILRLYNHSAGISEVLLISGLSIILAFAAIDIPVMISSGMLNIITGLFGLTASPGIVLLLILGPLFEPFYCMLEVFISCTAGLILSGPVDNSEIPDYQHKS